EPPRQDLLAGPPESLLLRDAAGLLRGAIPDHDLALAVDGDAPVRDLREDREAPLLLERDPLVELRVRERGRGVRGEGEQGLDLLLAPLARPAAVHGKHAVERSFRA